MSGAASLDQGAQSASAQITEDTEQVLREMLHRELPLESPNIVSYIKFDRVHRLGARKRNSSNPRPIVAKFERYQDREIIRKAGMEMNSNPRSKYKVREQFPKEIEDRRKLLYSAMYRLKANPQNRVNMVRDKLYVNGKLYIPEEDSEYKLPPPRSTYKRPEIGSYSGNQYARFGPNRQYAPYNGHQNTQGYSDRQAPTFGRARDIQREKLYTPPPPPYPRPDQIPNTYNRFNILANLSSNNTMNSFNERLPGQKHKTLSPLSEEGSPKKQKDINRPDGMNSISENSDETLYKSVDPGNTESGGSNTISNSQNSEPMEANSNYTDTQCDQIPPNNTTGNQCDETRSNDNTEAARENPESQSERNDG